MGSLLVRNEDVFVERAIRNIVTFCDRIYVFDHLSNDRTPDILRALAREFDHVELERSPRTTDSHRPLERSMRAPRPGRSVWTAMSSSTPRRSRDSKNNSRPATTPTASASKATF